MKEGAGVKGIMVGSWLYAQRDAHEGAAQGGVQLLGGCTLKEVAAGVYVTGPAICKARVSGWVEWWPEGLGASVGQGQRDTHVAPAKGR